MLVHTTLSVLLLAAATTVEASMVSMQSEGKLTFCGKQSCFFPNTCLPFLGVEVCVRTPAPTCSKTLCPPGYECALLQDLCWSRPCYPKPYCVKKSPCGDCKAPDQYCQLLPEPECKFVVEPTCDNKVCKPGEICHEMPLACKAPPCRVTFKCDPAWPWLYSKGSKSGSKKSSRSSSGSKKSKAERVSKAEEEEEEEEEEEKQVEEEEPAEEEKPEEEEEEEEEDEDEDEEDEEEDD